MKIFRFFVNYLQTKRRMKTISVVVGKAEDGTYNAYCSDFPTIFGMGDTIEDAKADLMESIRILKEEIGKDNALLYPDWLDSDCQETVTSDNAVFASPGSL